MRVDTITVPEIHCDHCKTSIERALRPLAGVHSAHVDVDARSVMVEFDESVLRRADLVLAIEQQGYDVPDTP